MAGKISPLTWTAPPDGGSPIKGYRVQIYEGSTLVTTLSSESATVQVTASETLGRTALIQARNDLGLSRPLSIAVPAGVAGGTTPTPTVPTLQITKLSDSSARFTLSAVPSNATQYELFAIAYPDQQEDNPPLLERYTGTAPPFTLSLPGYEAYFVTGVRWFMRIYYPTGDPVDTAKTPMPAQAAPAPIAPTITLTGGDAQATATQSTTGSNIASSTLTVVDTADASRNRLVDPAPTFPYLITGLTNGRSYQVLMTVKNSANVTATSTSNTVTPVAVAAPATGTTYTFDSQNDLNAFDYTPSFISGALTPSVANSRLTVSGGYAVINRTVTDRSVTRRYEWEGFDRLNPGSQGGMRWNVISANSFWVMDGSALGYFLNGNFNSVTSLGTMPNGTGARMAIEIDPDGVFRIYRSEGGNPLALVYTGAMAGTGLPYTSGTAGVWGSNCSIETAIVPT